MRTRLTNAIVQMYFMTDFDIIGPIRPESVHENPSTISLRVHLIILTITMKGGYVAKWLVRWGPFLEGPGNLTGPESYF